jgi:hypothetical protein
MKMVGIKRTFCWKLKVQAVKCYLAALQDAKIALQLQMYISASQRSEQPFVNNAFSTH